MVTGMNTKAYAYKPCLLTPQSFNGKEITVS